MKRFKVTLLTLLLTMLVSSTALAGNIPGFRTAGQIPGLRTSGQIPAPRASSTTRIHETMPTSPLGTMIGGGFASVIRMLLDASALL